MRELFRKVKEFRFSSPLVRQALGLVYRSGKTYRLPFGPLRGYPVLYDQTVNFKIILGLQELDAFNIPRGL